MKCLLIGLFLISHSLFAQTLTRVDADYRCENEGGGIAFKIDPNARIWQTDVGEAIGLELKILNFNANTCSGCYKFEAVLMDQIKVRGRVSAFKLNYEAFNEEANKWEKVLRNVKCVRVE